MGALRRFLGLETRASPPAPAVKASDPFLASYFGLGWNGRQYASPDEAVQCIAVAARCVSLIAEGLASLPLNVLRLTEDGGREPAPDHYLMPLLNSVSNDRATAFSVREGLVRDVATWGNGFARQHIDGRGRVIAIDHLPHPWVGIERLPSGRLRFRVTDPVHGTIVLTQDETVHLRYATRDGFIGVSPLQWAGAAIGLVVGQADLAQSQVDRGFTPDLSFETDASFFSAAQGNQAASPYGHDMAENAFQRLKKQLHERVQRLRNEPFTLLLEGGLTAKPLAPSGREAQFHESRLTGMEDVARLYGVPLSVVGLGKNASYGSLSEESRALVRDCFTPWARRIETELMRSLLTTESRRQFVIEHDLTGLLRGDLAARFAAYREGIEATVLCPNDARRMEGLPPRPGGNLYANPNTTPAAPPQQQVPPANAAA
ncbi:phage portal protein [Methylobacterium isbiliense]|uniref:Phage portal protein n=1 Tax=Methylobacterium isbiliense TaxID=315478 RepID=A0ABQ4SAD2_9HYPH|nr:phage portal protein [Methylobacterium isbiliense]MDN3622009.1 phage portal protein [Methylobacterium isbiliense]GJD99478.1 hypothetical protein GMJLKIPL_1396 [Methylobacterium isbiliense]